MCNKLRTYRETKRSPAGSVSFRRMPLRRDLKYGLAFLFIAAGLGISAARGSWWLLLAWPSLSFAAVSIA